MQQTIENPKRTREKQQREQKHNNPWFLCDVPFCIIPSRIGADSNSFANTFPVSAVCVNQARLRNQTAKLNYKNIAKLQHTKSKLWGTPNQTNWENTQLEREIITTSFSQICGVKVDERGHSRLQEVQQDLTWFVLLLTPLTRVHTAAMVKYFFDLWHLFIMFL